MGALIPIPLCGTGEGGPSFQLAPPSGNTAMTKERKSQKEAKKKPTLTLKEKRNAKKSKQDARSILGSGRPT
jgi:hypothetical protein